MADTEVNMSFKTDFKNPPAKNRIKPFWFWNGDMKEKEIEHQIAEMAEKGLGGAFICARQGLRVPYLSKEWFERVHFACEKAKKNGIENWLYDEYPYPSGMSGGEVMLRNPDAEHMILRTYQFQVVGGERIREKLSFGEVLYAKAVKELSEGIYDYENAIDLSDCIGNLQEEEIYQQTGLTSYNHKRFFSYQPAHILTCQLPEGKYKIEVFTQEAMGDFKYYGSFFDPCNKEAVQSFLDTTHERYKHHLGAEFGKTIHGMFSDEVGFLSPIPWSKKIISYFKEVNGYDLLPVLPALTNANYKDAAKIRYDFMQSIHQLFVLSYHKQVADWCRENNLLYATEVPSMRMSTQRYSDVIGGDTCHEKLGKSLEWIYDTYLPYYRANAKSVTSLASQLNKPYSMIESFHSIGWSMTLQDAKWMVDHMGAHGINLFNFHAFYYTIDSITKHDAPPSQFLQNPYWKHYRLLADYVGRMSVFNTYTNADVKIAVLDPAVTLLTKLGNPFRQFHYVGEDEKEKELCERTVRDWVHVCKTILFEQLNYDHLDAEILRDAEIKEGKILLGRASYSILVVPPCDAMELFATKKIEEFLAVGGRVIFLGRIPTEVIDEDTDVEKHYQEIIKHPNVTYLKTNQELKNSGVMEEVIPILHDLECAAVSFHTKDIYKKDCITSVRTGKQGEVMLFITNQGNQTVTGEVTVQLEGIQSAKRWSFETGEESSLPYKDNSILLTLGAFESICIEFLKDKVWDETKEEAKQSKVCTIPMNQEMKVSIEGSNIYRFEYFDISVDQQNWKNVDVKTFMEQMAETKLVPGEKLTYQSMFGTPKKIHFAYPMKTYYRNEFTVRDSIGDVWLLMDTGTITGDYVITLNGHRIIAEDFVSVFVNDQNNMRCNVVPYLRKGKNELFIEVEVKNDSDGVRDPIYLYGDFGVMASEQGMIITKMPDEASYRDTYTEGFPYYSGTTSFETCLNLKESEAAGIGALRFDFGDSRYDCMEVIVNGESIGVKAFTPYTFPVAKNILKTGTNEITLKVTNTLSNMLDGTYFDYKKHALVTIK